MTDVRSAFSNRRGGGNQQAPLIGIGANVDSDALAKQLAPLIAKEINQAVARGLSQSMAQVGQALAQAVSRGMAQIKPVVNVPPAAQPVVNVPETDFGPFLSEIRELVASSQDRPVEQVDATALADALGGAVPVEQMRGLLENFAAMTGEPLRALVDEKSLEAVIKRIGLPAGGGGGPSNVGLKDVSGEKVNPATEDTLKELAAGVSTDDMRLTYDGDGNVEFRGTAAAGSATSASVWTIQKFSYTAGDLVLRQTKADVVWDDRESLDW